MRAVNLLPSDLRGAAPKAAPGTRPEPVQGIGAYVVLGVLAFCVAALAGYVVMTNGVKQREADLATAQQRTSVATAKAAALQPYADFEAVAVARKETVRGLAAARFDWERALRDISHSIPGDVKLSALNGDMGLPGAAGSGSDPLRGSIQAPAITLAGCAPTQTDVARMMSRIKAVDGVTRVSLSKSEAAAATTGAPGSTVESPCGTDPANFSIVVFFEGAPSLAAYAPADTGSAANLPVPEAVNENGGGTAGADGAATPAGEEASGTTPAGDATTEPQATSSSSTSVTTATTPGGTP